MPKNAPSIRDPDDLFQRDVRNLIRLINDCPLLRGRPLTSIELSTTAKQVTHTLGRIPEGFFITSQDAEGSVWLDSPMTSRALPLVASATMTVSIWVF